MTAESITEVLLAWRDGRALPDHPLSRQVYAALHDLAEQRVHRLAGGTLNPTALINEAMLRLLDGSQSWNSRAHFYALAALHMRSVLLDHARRRGADKRGGGVAAVTLDEAVAGPAQAHDFMELHEAISALQREDARSAMAIELCYFAGLTNAEIAETCAVSLATIERDLRFGRAWLRTRLST